MWTDDLEIVESCGFRRSPLNFDSNDSIGEYAATDTFAYMKTPNEPPGLGKWPSWEIELRFSLFVGFEYINQLKKSWSVTD